MLDEVAYLDSLISQMELLKDVRSGEETAEYRKKSLQRIIIKRQEPKVRKALSDLWNDPTVSWASVENEEELHPALEVKLDQLGYKVSYQNKGVHIKPKAELA